MSTPDPGNTHSSFEEARDQNAQYMGFLASERITLATGEVFEIPNPSLLDDDQAERVAALDLDLESWDHFDDVLDEDGTVEVKGTLKEPHRKNGVLVEPYNTQLAKALFGERYEAFKKAGGRSNDVGLIWAKMRRFVADRRAADSKSLGSDPAVPVVPDADRIGSDDSLPTVDSGVAAS